MKRSWTWRDVLPAGAALTVSSVVTTETGVLVEADGPSAARCPACRRPSQARRRRYWRTLRDVVAHGRSVTLRVRVSRWRCQHAPRETAIFADRLAAVAAPHAQHTERCGAVVHLVGHALGGRAGDDASTTRPSNGMQLTLGVEPASAPAPAPDGRSPDQRASFARFEDENGAGACADEERPVP